MKSNPSVNATARDDPLPGTEASVHKSLPDFLSDGPMHNRSADPEPVRMTESEEMRVKFLRCEINPIDGSREIIIIIIILSMFHIHNNSMLQLLIDNEVLRQQLAAARRQISERTER